MYKRLIPISGVIAWMLVGLPAFIYHAHAPGWSWSWTAAFVLFGAAFALDTLRPSLFFLLAEAVAAIAIVALRCNGYEGTLLVVLAMQLGPRLNRSLGLTWIGVQTVFLGVTVAARLGPRAALLLAPPYLGFQLLAFFVLHVMAREAQAREELAGANAELRALQPLLDENSRTAERLRIAHELHDALGHRLTALSLNLEAVLHALNGAEKSKVELCQNLTRQLLADVRQIVAQSRAQDGLSIRGALLSLMQAIPRPAIHLEVAEDLRILDPAAAHAVLRCAQEIITNAARHSCAQNLWIAIEDKNGDLSLTARDDGRGHDGAGEGFGMRGMRERIEAAGGQIQFCSQAGEGFGVTALLPLRHGAA